MATIAGKFLSGGSGGSHPLAGVQKGLDALYSTSDVGGSRWQGPQILSTSPTVAVGNSRALNRVVRVDHGVYSYGSSTL